MNNFIELHAFYRDKEPVLINARHITYVTPLFDLESEEYATRRYGKGIKSRPCLPWNTTC